MTIRTYRCRLTTGEPTTFKVEDLGLVGSEYKTHFWTDTGEFYSFIEAGKTVGEREDNDRVLLAQLGGINVSSIILECVEGYA